MCMSVVNLVFGNKMTFPLLSHGLSPRQSRPKSESTPPKNSIIRSRGCWLNLEKVDLFLVQFWQFERFFYHRKNSPPVALVCQMMWGGNFEWELILIFSFVGCWATDSYNGTYCWDFCTVFIEWVGNDSHFFSSVESTHLGKRLKCKSSR